MCLRSQTSGDWYWVFTWAEDDRRGIYIDPTPADEPPEGTDEYAVFVAGGQNWPFYVDDSDGADRVTYEIGETPVETEGEAYVALTDGTDYRQFYLVEEDDRRSYFVGDVISIEPINYPTFTRIAPTHTFTRI